MNKEQQKQHLIDMMKSDEELGLYDETLEEAAEIFWLNDNTMSENDRDAYVNGFINGAKWQQEQDSGKDTADYIDRHLVQALVEVAKQNSTVYSEEDMLKSFMAGIKCESNKGENFEQFIKQFKNK
jgi:hypothetical protein